MFGPCLMIIDSCRCTYLHVKLQYSLCIHAVYYDITDTLIIRAGSKYVFISSSHVASLFLRFKVKSQVNALVDNKHESTSQVV